MQDKINKSFYRVMDDTMKFEFIGFLIAEKIKLKEIMETFDITAIELKKVGYNVDGSVVKK